jgi:endonuclease/exonuclease/phosphatase family metal-dependent hydrolase
MKIFSKIWRIARIPLALMFLWIAFWLTYGTLTDYRPTEKNAAPLEKNAPIATISDSVVTFFTWNIGYCGMGSETDFFFDNGGSMVSGGAMVRPDKSLVDKYLTGFETFLKQNKADFFLLQEIDRASKRSYFTEQFDSAVQMLPNYSAAFGLNYAVKYVPLPLFEPWHCYGATQAGIGTFAKYQPTSSERLQLPSEFGWPTRIFQLDRCLLAQRYKTATKDKELIVINLHNSAHDSDGSLKAKEMGYLKQFCTAEYAKGNYVIAAGDWNECPPYFDFRKFAKKESSDGYSQLNIEPDFMPEGWQFIYDATASTNRKAAHPYEKGKTFETLIDFYLISPNVQALKVRTVTDNYRYSDHNPVYGEFKLQK